MSRSPRIAVVVVTWNSAAVLPGLLGSLEPAMAGLRYQVVVADNASADDCVEVAGRLAPGCTIVQVGRNAGYAAGINAALAAAEPFDAALVVNPDVRLAPGCVPAMLAHLGTEAGVGLPAKAGVGLPAKAGVGLPAKVGVGLGAKVGGGFRTGIVVPVLRRQDGSRAWSLRREPSLPRALGEALLGQRAGRHPRLGETVLDEAEYRRPTTADWATGAVMLISAECLAVCGPWDESFFLYSEETEFALRARERGFLTRLAPDADAVHLEGESKTSPRLWTLLTLNRIKLYRQRHSRAATALFWAAVLLRESARAARGDPGSRRATAALIRPWALRQLRSHDIAG